MHTNQILIAAIQETMLPDTCLKSPPDYEIVSKPRIASRGKGGGLAFILHKSISYRKIELSNQLNDENLEQQGVKLLSGNSNITLCNVYIPPSSSCKAGFNRHDELWCSKLESNKK